MANRKSNSRSLDQNKRTRNRTGTSQKTSAGSKSSGARRKRSSASEDRMVLKLLLLVMAVLVIFEGRLILTMFSQSRQPVIITASGKADEPALKAEAQKTKAEKADDGTDQKAGVSGGISVVSSDTAEPAPTQPASEGADVPPAQTGNEGGALAGFSGENTQTASTGTTEKTRQAESSSSSIYDENGYVTSEHLDNDCVVPLQSQSVDDSYFSDAVFIGDSRMEGFRYTSGITQGDWLTSVGMCLTSISDSKVSTPDGAITVYQGLSGRQYNKIYLMLGANDLGFWPWEEFLPTALSVLEQFHKLQPNAVIYICSCIYVEESKVVTDYVNNANVIEVNKGLLQACEQLPYCWYVNLNEVLSNGWQALIQDASEDGVHLYEHYSKIMLSYLKNHYLGSAPAVSSAGAESSDTGSASSGTGEEAPGAESSADDAAAADPGTDPSSSADGSAGDADINDAPEPPPEDVNGIVIVS